MMIYKDRTDILLEINSVEKFPTIQKQIGRM